MIFTLGVFSFFQIFFLPGALIFRVLGYRITPLVFLNYIFPFSLGINFLIVLITTLLGIYQPQTVRLIFISELLMFILLRKRSKIQLLEEVPFSTNRGDRILYFVGILVFFFYLTRWIKSFGTVIHWTDAALSWNVWALEWSHSQLPTITRLYPQLISAIYSLPYQFTGVAEIEFFTLTAITGIPILTATAVMLNSVYYPRLRKTLVFCTVFFLYLTNRLSIPLSGYVDAPLASVSLILLMNVFIQKENSDHLIEKRFFMGSFIAGFLALIKHLGVPMMFVYPILVSLVSGRWIGMKKFIQSLTISGAISFSWYGIKLIDILKGKDISGFTGIVNTAQIPIIDRIPSSSWFLHQFVAPNEFGTIAIIVFYSIFMLVLVKGFLKDHVTRFLLAVFFAAFVFWALVAPYDTRNISIGIPFLSLASGLVLSGDTGDGERVRRHPFKLSDRSKFGIMLLFLFAMVFAQFKLTNEILFKQQREQKEYWKKMGS
jgi:hypothetical protein